ncbi:restriction endonuclease subunit R [Thermosipho melanesiensis]|uniref:Type III restriction enzyme, res subunit n=2 Tax=Thermosipho melanesiensis TaxID=46541 RepID=A6LNM7_THEM4|nr:DEAD/DEAH box helicase family protein [Thermosipho melanesiensis]ABR31528.1 type III restriction enzyme, res subunit [Thermosipho melanesiensis BI429]APT74569.1 restriction endonuclease subunit R [Thermosipho melanesiensis]OOC35273.1 restriction endonuclease subunit R [Thermosipho melanesiensis]OOC35492.1 restriction endonuclease subunit R [Thermosipho melanesiensis]OOC36528.1 restriction endonuclease subunit R [Thermosipho melanesiensis]
MSFKDLDLKRTYSSENDDILNDFYIPVLKESISYFDFSGFFTSESLAIAARGILGLVKNDGYMKLIVSPRLTYKDIETIKDASQEPSKYINYILDKDLELLENEFVKDHLFALGWMIANNKLEIKIALLYNQEGKIMSSDEIINSGLFHQKIGIFTDKEGNVITFSGSINETLLGWQRNVEEFKVFRSWIEIENEYVKEDIKKFEKYWNNNATNLKVIEIPEAIKQKLIKIVPKNFDINSPEKWYIKNENKNKIKKITLFEHQIKAIENWESNNFRGIISMATGTGKTYTAIGAIDKILKRSKKNFIVITVPYSHLIEQWNNSIKRYGLDIGFIVKCFSENSKWYSNLKRYVRKLLLGQINNVLVISTHDTLVSDKMKDILLNLKANIATVLVADEVHSIGSLKRRENLSNIFRYRLGLSATPKRMYDEFGNNFLKEYFGEIVYEFSLCDAIYKINPLTYKSFLTPYYYYPYLCALTETETRKYNNLTMKIFNILKNSSDDFYDVIENDEKIKMLLIKRSKIIKAAKNKLKVLENILSDIERKHGDISHTIIFTDDKLITETLDLLKSKKIYAVKFTQELSNKQRIEVLNNFGEGIIQVLVAMKILDEGVDVPESKIAIIMSSSKNPREFIQRIGRILRVSENKKYSYIYDIITKPKLIDDSVLSIENKLFKAEKERVRIIAKCSLNYKEVMDKVNEI